MPLVHFVLVSNLLVVYVIIISVYDIPTTKTSLMFLYRFVLDI